MQVGGPKAREYLLKLTKDPDYGVAMYAKAGLSSSSHGYEYAPDAFKCLP